MTANPQHAASPRHRYSVIPRVLIFVEYDNQVLLLKGAPDKPLWPNMYNGVGGHVEPGETVYAAALRELREETGIQADRLHLRGMANIRVPDGPADILLFVYLCNVNSPRIEAGEEGSLHWFDSESLPPAEAMLPDLPLILPKVRSMRNTDQPFYALYTYNPDGSLHISFDS